MNNDLTKKYYKISEVAEIAGIPTSTLRFWEQRFTVIKPRRNDHGQRFYTPDDIEKIRMVYFLVKEKGMKLEAAEQELKRNSSGINRRCEAIETLTRLRDQIKGVLAVLDKRYNRVRSV